MRLEGYKILVTGGRGYVGSHVAKSLLAAGAEVYIIDNRYVTQNKIEGTHFYMTSYDDYYILDKMEEFGIDGVVHCAGTSLVGPSVDDPSEYYNNNVSKTIRFLDHLRQWKHIPFIVFSSSAAVYGNSEEKLHESSVISPVNPYGNTKMMIERILRDYEAAYGMKSWILRYFNAAGADVWDCQLGPEVGDTHILPQLFETKLADGVFSINGDDYDTPDGTCIRDYVHVCDLALIHLKACVELAAGSPSKTYNIGTGQGYSNQEIVSVFFKAVNGIDVVYKPRRFGDPDRLISDTSKFDTEQEMKLHFSDIETIVKSMKAYYEKHRGL